MPKVIGYATKLQKFSLIPSIIAAPAIQRTPTRSEPITYSDGLRARRTTRTIAMTPRNDAKLAIGASRLMDAMMSSESGIEPATRPAVARSSFTNEWISLALQSVVEGLG